MRFLSVYLPFLSTDRIRRSEGAPRFQRDRPPLAVWAKAGSAQKLVAVDPAAREAGLRPDMALASARAMRPDLELRESDTRAEAQTLAAVADWLRRFTPLAGLDAPDGAMLDIEGCAHLFGGEATMGAEIKSRLCAQGFHTRWAIASNPALAWALARFSTTRILANDDHRTAARILRLLPAAALRIPDETVAGLRTAGLTRVGDLLTRPRAPLAARFGSDLIARLDAITGAARDPISPRFEAAAYMAERRFAEGLARAEDIEAALADLSRDLCALLERHGEGARRILASFFRVDGAVRHVEAGTSRPQRDPVALARLLHEKIDALGEDGLDTGYGFDVIRLAATHVESFRGTMQTGLVSGDSTYGNATREMVDLVDRLGARFGIRRVQRLYFQDTHIPEFAATASPAAHGRGSVAPAFVFDGAQARPTRLFDAPEPVEAMAAVPDGPPLRFRWRRVTHEIAAYEGPERIAPEWWRDAGLTRDYFQVEDKSGGRFWLFREGLFGRETAQPRWFVHGVFG
ncbi:MAG: DNA polymerase Y family protein [Hyphomicrobiales bacterium]|nr:DNA polymerase Y family protein [Hyphomicrobiales bacterium]